MPGEPAFFVSELLIRGRGKGGGRRGENGKEGHGEEGSLGF